MTQKIDNNEEFLLAVGKDDKVKDEYRRLNPDEGATISSAEAPGKKKVGINKIPKEKIKLVLALFVAAAVMITVTGLVGPSKKTNKKSEDVAGAAIPARPVELALSDSDRVMEQEQPKRAESVIEAPVPVKKQEQAETFQQQAQKPVPVLPKEVPVELKEAPKESKKQVEQKPAPVSRTSAVHQEQPVRTSALPSSAASAVPAPVVNDVQEEDFSDIFAMPSGASGQAEVTYPSPSSRTAQTPVLADYGSSYENAAKEQFRSDYSRQNMQDEKEAWVEKKQAQDNRHILESGVEEPVSEYTLHQGSVIPIILVTGINSDLPGMIVGRVLQDVYNSVDGKYLVIPAGSSVTGEYNSAVAFGQKRVLVAWQRLIRPDGSSLDLHGFGGADLSGYSGYSDKVDWHLKEISQLVGLSTILNIGAGAISSTSSSGILKNAIVSAADDTQDIIEEVAKKVINIQPTITIRPLTKCNIMVGKDIILPHYDMGMEE